MSRGSGSAVSIKTRMQLGQAVSLTMQGVTRRIGECGERAMRGENGSALGCQPDVPVSAC